MKPSRQIALLIFMLALLVVGAYVDYRRSVRPEPALVKLGQVERAEFLFHGTRVAAARTGDHWRIREFAGTPVNDERANEDLIAHVLDLVKVLSNETRSPLNVADAPSYGMAQPELALTLGWDRPTAGEDVVVFGHRDLSGHRSFAFFPKRPLLVEVPSSAVTVLEGKSALDLRDRRITGFEPDDVEELTMSGKCGVFALTRDGDRWMSGAAALSDKAVEGWLSSLLGTLYDKIDDSAPTSISTTSDNPVCRLELHGLRSRAETVDVFKADGTLWSRSSALRGRYRLPQGFLALLVPPRGSLR